MPVQKFTYVKFNLYRFCSIYLETGKRSKKQGHLQDSISFKYVCSVSVSDLKPDTQHGVPQQFGYNGIFFRVWYQDSQFRHEQSHKRC